MFNIYNIGQIHTGAHLLADSGICCVAVISLTRTQIDNRLTLIQLLSTVAISIGQQKVESQQLHPLTAELC